jgi:anti-anti-sigma factor
MNPESHVHRISLSGAMSIFRAIELRDQLLAAFEPAAEIEVDLSQVTEIDSAGVQLMIAAQHQAQADGKVLRFVGHADAVLEALALCELAPDLTPDSSCVSGGHP